METVGKPLTAPVPPPPAAALKLMSDERLARWAARGSEAAFATIFHRHHQALHRYCHSIVGNGHDAADALQNTMVKALRALPGETREIALKPWLYRIAHNESISLLRARRTDGDLAAAAHVGDPAAATIVDSRERLRELSGDLRELTEQQRGALLMRELGGLDFSEVASALQVSAAAAKQTVYEARRALQALQEGRAMECDRVRRKVSDGDRRTLRAMGMRGHLRACAGCRDFEAALHARPAQLAALAPPLPLAAAAALLQSLLGGGAGHGGGGGLTAALGASVKGGAAGGALSLGAAKAATVVVVAGSLAGGAAYVAPSAKVEPATSPASGTAAAHAAGRPVALAVSVAYDADGTVSAASPARPARRSGATANAPRPASSRPAQPGSAGQTAPGATAAQRRPAIAPGRSRSGSAAARRPAAAAARRPAAAGAAGRPPAAAARRPTTAGRRPPATTGSRAPATRPTTPAPATPTPATARPAPRPAAPASPSSAQPPTGAGQPAAPAARAPAPASGPPAAATAAPRAATPAQPR